MPRAVRAVGLMLAAGAAIVGSTLIILVLAQRGHTLPNTRMAGIDVGQMTPDEVRAALEPEVRRRATEAVVLRVEDDRFTLDPERIDYRVDLEASVGAAYARGRRASPASVATRLTSLWTVEDVDLVDAWDRSAAGRWVATTVAAATREPDPGGFTFDPASGAVTTVPPAGGRTFDPVAVLAAVEDELAARRGEALLPAEVSPPPLPEAAVEALVEEVRRALAGPLVLTAADDRLVLDPATVAAALSIAVVGEGEDVAAGLAADAAELDRLVGDDARRRFDVEPVAAEFRIGREPPVTFDDKGSTAFAPVAVDVGFQNGRDGTRFDPVRLAEQVVGLVRAGRSQAPLALEIIEAEVPTDVRDAVPTHLLGTFTTYFTPGQARNGNIRTLADVIDGTVVAPGATFSINDLSGPRTCDRGYVLAGTIVGGELIDTCGGGVSQFGTTTFNAAFFAGLQLDAWKAHSWYLSRYPMGREATLTYPSLDVRFTNTTSGWLLVRTAHTESSVTVSIYGRPQWERVLARHGAPTAQRAAPLQVRSNPELPAGVERVVQAGAGGFTVEVVRRLEDATGAAREERIVTVYTPQPRIVEVGTGPAPDDGEA